MTAPTTDSAEQVALRSDRLPDEDPMTNPDADPGTSHDGWTRPVAKPQESWRSHESTVSVNETTIQLNETTIQVSEATIPIIPESGYDQPSYPPPQVEYYEPTLVEPLPTPAATPPLMSGYPPHDPPAGYQNFGYSPAPTYQNPSYAPRPTVDLDASTPLDAYQNPPFEAYAPTPYANSAQVPVVVTWQDARGIPQGYSMQPAAEHPQAGLVLVLALLGFVTIGLTCPFAWVIGSRARRQMRRDPGRWSPSAALTVGWVLGILGSLFWLALTGFVLMVIGLASLL